MPMAYTKELQGMRSAVCAFEDVVLLLQNDASCSKTGGIRLKMNWPGRIGLSQCLSLFEGITEVLKRLYHGQSE
jgi:hypothetical protein